MALTEARRQELTSLLEAVYNQRAETEQLLSVTTNPTEKDRLEFDLEKCLINIKRLEKEFEDQPLTDEPDIIEAYLDAIRERYISYDTARLIRLNTWRGASGASNAETTSNLRKMEAFLESEETVRRPLKATAPLEASLKEMPIDKFLFENKRIMLLGVPGAGKSITLLRLVKILGQPWQETGDDVTAMSLPRAWLNRVPIFAKLSRWKDPQMGLVDFLQEQISDLGVPELAERLPQLMKAGRVVLLLDGLDKLPGLNREQSARNEEDPRARAIAELDYTPDWSGVACVLSCRSKEAARGPGWPNLQLIELKQKQVTGFAATYFERDPQGEALADSFVTELYNGNNPGAIKLQGLVTRPFYLVKLLAYYHIQKSNGLSDQDALPDNPARLIKFSIGEILNREVDNHWLTDDEAQNLNDWLAFLAFRITDSGRSGLIDKMLATVWLYEVIKQGTTKNQPITPEEKEQAEIFWRQAEGTGFLTVTDTKIQFFCQALQEYFCAIHFQNLTLSAPMLEHTALPRFKEIWPIWAKLDKNLRTDLVTFIKENYNEKVCNDVGTVLSFLNDERVIEPLVDLVGDPKAEIRAKAIKVLGRLTHPQVVPQLTLALKDKESQVRISAVNALSELGEAAGRPLMGALRDPDGEVQYQAVVALGKLVNPQALNILTWLQQNEKGLTPESVRLKEALTITIDQIVAKYKD